MKEMFKHFYLTTPPGHSKRKFIFQPPIFRGHVSFREGVYFSVIPESSVNLACLARVFWGETPAWRNLFWRFLGMPWVSMGPPGLANGVCMLRTLNKGMIYWISRQQLCTYHILSVPICWCLSLSNILTAVSIYICPIQKSFKEHLFLYFIKKVLDPHSP